MADKDKDIISETGDNTDEITPESPETKEEGASVQPNEVEKLTSDLAGLNDRYLRLMAEYDNFRKRSAREREEIYPTATAATVEKFLPVMDNLERASDYETGTEEFAKGFEMICQSLGAVFKELGVEPIGEVGETFDPNLHNAVMHIEDSSLGENVVSQVMQKGYRIGGRILRYAMVQTAN